MTLCPNLLPTSCFAERARRRRIRQWLAVGAAETIVLGAVCVVLRLGGHDPIAGMGATIRSTAEQISLMSGALATSRVELAGLERRLAVASEVARQPDWSIVLAMLAKKGAGVIRLDSCELVPGGRAEGSNSPSYRFTIVGVCPSQSDLTGFVQELESTRAFSRIKVVETRRASEDPASTSVRFTIESWMTEGG